MHLGSFTFLYLAIPQKVALDTLPIKARVSLKQYSCTGATFPDIWCYNFITSALF